MTSTLSPAWTAEPVNSAADSPPSGHAHDDEWALIGPCDWADVDQLFAELARSGSEDERRRRRSKVITACLPVADRIARRFVGRGEPSDDLLQVARLGLIKTVDRYDPSKGHFLAFAIPTIRGEVRRYFRDATWTVRVPRRVQETQLHLRDAVDTLSQRLSRTPTSAELAEELDIDVGELSTSQSASSAYQPMSLDAPLAATDARHTDTLGDMQGAEDPHYGQVEDLMAVRDALEELDPRRRAIVGMVFFDCLTQREVARRFNVSQVQISRLLSDALERIRTRVCSDTPAVMCVLGSLVGFL